MKTVTCYLANDNSRWDTEAEALARNEMIAAVDAAMSCLGPDEHDRSGCDFTNGSGYVQHGSAAVKLARQRLYPITRAALSCYFDDFEKKRGRKIDLDTVHPSTFGRLIDADNPLSRAWGRILCIDDLGREWGQPYYADHPEEAKDFEIRKGA